jgi:hypothetical protein
MQAAADGVGDSNGSLASNKKQRIYVNLPLLRLNTSWQAVLVLIKAAVTIR